MYSLHPSKMPAPVRICKQSPVTCYDHDEESINPVWLLRIINNHLLRLVVIKRDSQLTKSGHTNDCDVGLKTDMQGE